MPPRVKPAPPPPETAPEPRKTTRQAAKLAVARIAASVQELESVADDEALAPVRAFSPLFCPSLISTAHETTCS